jgi:hypothetical protein
MPAGGRIILTTRAEGAHSSYISAIASKLEHNSTRPVATSARNPSDIKSRLCMEVPVGADIDPNLLNISESAFW